MNHVAEDLAAHVQFGHTRTGAPALINRLFAEAEVRIVTGFIEPHFFAGFSGGPKGIMPGVAALQTVMSNHGTQHIGHPQAAFGVTDGNPIWEEMRDIALRVGPSFLVNVTLNERREITGIFAGDLLAAHRAGIDFVRASAMQPVPEPFDVVVTTNSGYPLDMNLYQAVKGMAAAARIVKDGGTIVLAAECSEGVPAGSPHDRLLRSVANGEELLAMLAESAAPGPNNGRAKFRRSFSGAQKFTCTAASPERHEFARPISNRVRTSQRSSRANSPPPDPRARGRVTARALDDSLSRHGQGRDKGRA